MANSTLIQVRASDADKKQAAAILESLGTNISSVVNMLLKQIILTESIPFEVTLKHEKKYTNEQVVREVAATMMLENMELDDKDMALLGKYQQGEITGDDARAQLLKEMGLEHE